MWPSRMDAQLTSNLVHHFYSSTVEYCCLGIVRHTIADHESEVDSNVLHCSVGLQVHLPTHRRKVHRVFYQITVIWHLTEHTAQFHSNHKLHSLICYFSLQKMVFIQT